MLAIVVQFPFTHRPWAVPGLVALYRSEEWNTNQGRRPKTPARVLRHLVAVLLQRNILLYALAPAA